MSLKKRLAKAIKAERGIRLSPAEARRYAKILGVELPQLLPPPKAKGNGSIRVHIRWMIRRDMPEILDIEGLSFEFPWSEDSFIRCLRQGNCIGMVAEYKDQIVGFMIYELHRSRLHLLNFAVHPDYRRQGVGSQMIRKLAGKLSERRRVRILLEVREQNLLAQLFFRTMGFRAISVLRDFYEDTAEDAYVMEYRHKEKAHV